MHTHAHRHICRYNGTQTGWRVQRECMQARTFTDTEWQMFVHRCGCWQACRQIAYNITHRHIQQVTHTHTQTGWDSAWHCFPLSAGEGVSGLWAASEYHLLLCPSCCRTRRPRQARVATVACSSASSRTSTGTGNKDTSSGYVTPCASSAASPCAPMEALSHRLGLHGGLRESCTPGQEGVLGVDGQSKLYAHQAHALRLSPVWVPNLSDQAPSLHPTWVFVSFPESKSRQNLLLLSPGPGVGSWGHVCGPRSLQEAAQRGELEPPLPTGL